MLDFHAPGYLSEFLSPVDSVISTGIESEYGDNITVFKMNCVISQIIQTWNDEDDSFGGTISAITNLNQEIILFDQYKNGYNGVMQIYDPEYGSSIKKSAIKPGIEIFVVFQYNGDEAESVAMGLSNDAQDYFSWIVIYKYENDQLNELLSYECM